MKETFFTNLIELAFTIASIILVPMISAWLRSKTQNERLKSLISDVENVIKTCVDNTEQVFVKKLKETGAWDKEAQMSVLQNTVTDAISMLLDSSIATLENNNIEIEEYIKSKVEAYIQSKKVAQENAKDV
jgi:hypothetical protein